MLEFEIKDLSYPLQYNPNQKLGQMDRAERDQFRSWGQMGGANKQLATIAMKKPEGWKRNQGWGAGCPVRCHAMPSRLFHLSC